MPGRQSGQADLRRQSRFARSRSRTTRATSSSTATSPTGGRSSGFWRNTSRRRSSISRPSRTSIARSTGPAEFVRTNVQGTFQLLDAARALSCPAAAEAAGGVSLPARLDRRGVRLAGPDRPVHRDEPLRPQFALFGVEGGGRSFRPRVLPHLRPAGAGDQLLEQLRPVPVSRKADSADDPQRLGGQAAAGLWRRAERARLAVRRGPLPGAVAGA